MSDSGRTDHLGDPLPEGAVQRLGTRRMQYGMSQIAYARDGGRAFVTSGDALHVWDLMRGERVGDYRVTGHPLVALDLREDGRMALIADRSGGVVTWDLHAHRATGRFETGRSSLVSACLSPDGLRALTLDRETSALEEWDVATGGRRIVIVPEKPEESFVRLCIYGPGRTALIGHHREKDSVFHYDLTSGEMIRMFAGDYVVYDMCLSADGERLLIGTRHQSTEWRLSDATCLGTFTGHLGHAVPSVAYARDDGFLLTGSRDGSIRLWDRNRAEVVRRWSPHQDHVTRMRVSPDGAWVLSYGGDRLLTETSIGTGAPRLRWERHRSGVQAVAFTPDGSRALSGSADRTVRVWETDGWKAIRTIVNPGDEVNALTVSPGGDRVAAASKDGTVREFSTATGALLRTLSGHLGYVRAVAYMPDGGGILSGADDGTVRLWDIAQERTVRTMTGHLGGVLCLAASPDGGHAMSGGRDGTVREWDLKTGELLQTVMAHRGWVQAVAYRPDGRCAISAGRDGRVVEWDLKEGREERAFDHGAWVADARYATDGKVVCSAGQDGKALLWDRASGRRLKALSGHDGGIHALAISPDGRWMVSGSADTTSLVWKLR